MIKIFIGAILIFLGIFFIVISNIGIVRFSHLYTKLHAAGIVDSCGATLLLIGLSLQHTFSVNSIKVMLLIPIIWITSSTNSYILAKTYYKNRKNTDEP